MRQIGVLSVLVVAVTAAGTAHAAHRREKVFEYANLALASRPFTDAVIERRRLREAPADYHTGVYRTSDGIAVRVYTSNAYPVNPRADQSAVDFLGSLLHGPELGKLTLYILTPDEVHAQCGFGATACYYPAGQALYSPGEDSDGLPVEQVLAHEYGHHVAAHRSNTPWNAADWGPKRWATYMGICPGVLAHDYFPGAEPPNENYRSNPGEGWAESYRAYNERAAQTWPAFGWPIVSDMFKPDDQAFDAIRDDVLDPWKRNTTVTRIGTLRARATKTLSFDTPLDGTLTLHVSGTASPSIQTATASSTRVSTTVCGQDSVSVTLHARRAGAFRLTVSEP